MLINYSGDYRHYRHILVKSKWLLGQLSRSPTHSMLQRMKGSKGRFRYPLLPHEKVKSHMGETLKR